MKRMKFTWNKIKKSISGIQVFLKTGLFATDYSGVIPLNISMLEVQPQEARCGNQTFWSAASLFLPE